VFEYILKTCIFKCNFIFTSLWWSRNIDLHIAIIALVYLDQLV